MVALGKHSMVFKLFFFFSIRVFFTDTDDSQDSKGSEGTIFYSILPLPPAHKHWGIYLQLCMWDDYHVLLIATLVFTRLLFDEIYHLIELPFEWLIDDAMFVCLLDEFILGFCYSDLTLETGGFELASTITVVLQANRLTKCASKLSTQKRDCLMREIFKTTSLLKTSGELLLYFFMWYTKPVTK